LHRTRNNIEETIAEYTNNLHNWDETLRTSALESIRFYAHKIDLSSLSPKTRDFLVGNELVKIKARTNAQGIPPQFP